MGESNTGQQTGPTGGPPSKGGRLALLAAVGVVVASGFGGLAAVLNSDNKAQPSGSSVDTSKVHTTGENPPPASTEFRTKTKTDTKTKTNTETNTQTNTETNTQTRTNTETNTQTRTNTNVVTETRVVPTTVYHTTTETTTVTSYLPAPRR